MKHFAAFFLPLLLAVDFGSTTKWDNVWPKPQTTDQQDHYLVIDPTRFEILSSQASCDLIHHAIERQLGRMFAQDCGALNAEYKGDYLLPRRINRAMDMYNAGELHNLSVKFDGACEHLPQMDMAEGYRLQVDRSGAVLHGDSVWGALRGLETFAQLLHHSGRDEFLLNLVKIDDFPRFSHRGLLIDSSRHFLPLRSIHETLDAMEINKLNVLHWHIVDDQSFPFVSETFPELSAQGAYNYDHHMTYPVEAVQRVLELARLRGIRVLVEFDTPGHTLSWGKSQKNLLTACYDANGKPNGEFGPIDPTHEDSYPFIQKLLAEVARRFPDQYLHLGGDEVPFQCWQSNPAIKEFMEKHRMGTDYSKLESFYVQKLVDIVQELKKSYIVWQEVFDNNVTLKSDTVVHVWIQGDDSKDPLYWPREMERVVKAGYHTLVSAPWYLDWISWSQDWIKYYETEPLSFNATDAQKKLVLGGEACMWGEFVDGANLISKTWPRASSVAERLWSDASVKDAEQARPRFHAMHCRLEKLGFRVGPIDGPGFCQCDYAL